MKNIILSNGSIAKVDDEDFEELSKRRWWLHKDESHPIGYAQGQIGRSGDIKYMHRIVLSRKLDRELLTEEISDHIEHDTLNNCRYNVRLADRSQSQHNKGAYRNNKSGFKGVSFDAFTGKWTSQINAGGKNVYRGRFTQLKDAAQVYVLMSYLHHKDFSNVEGLWLDQ